ncbi:DUF2884 family protein [Aliikangiella sp. IMCC44632]
MKKVIFIGLLCGASTFAVAKDGCEYATDFNVNLNENQLIFSQKNGDELIFDKQGLTINGSATQLDSTQAQAAMQFQRESRLLVPKVADVAIEGIELGMKAAGIVMTAFFTDEPQIQQELIAPIEKLSENIRSHISPNHFNAQSLENSFEKAIDEELEAMIETAVTKYSGKLIGNILSSVFSGDSEELKDLEFRMETLEHDIEKYVEENAEALEVKAEQLCTELAALDKLDNQLLSVNGYPKQGLIHTDSKRSTKLGKIEIDL